MAQPNKDQGLTPYQPFGSAEAPPQSVINQLEFFFGKPSQPEKLVDFTDHHAATYHFPDAFAGKNTYLRDTLSNRAQSPQTWQTSVALPYVQVDNVTVQWDRCIRRPPTSPCPYEGASRMQTSYRKSHRDHRAPRHRTDGRERFLPHRSGPQALCRSDHVDSVLRSGDANFDVLYAYLSCHNTTGTTM